MMVEAILYFVVAIINISEVVNDVSRFFISLWSFVCLKTILTSVLYVAGRISCTKPWLR